MKIQINTNYFMEKNNYFMFSVYVLKYSTPNEINRILSSEDEME
jgi:hypothetical protein